MCINSSLPAIYITKGYCNFSLSLSLRCLWIHEARKQFLKQQRNETLELQIGGSASSETDTLTWSPIVSLLLDELGLFNQGQGQEMQGLSYPPHWAWHRFVQTVKRQFNIVLQMHSCHNRNPSFIQINRFMKQLLKHIHGKKPSCRKLFLCKTSSPCQLSWSQYYLHHLFVSYMHSFCR